MKPILGLMLLLAALLTACGGGGGDQQQSSNGTNRPSKGFQTTDKQAKPTARAGDIYVHAHLDIGSQQWCWRTSPGPRQKEDWATGDSGECTGRYLGGESPFTAGTTGWSGWWRESSRIRIEQHVQNGTHITCYVSARTSGDCFTDSGSHLVVTAATDDFVLVRGMCRDGDRACTPHYGSP
jgi:hypothetical protein